MTSESDNIISDSATQSQLLGATAVAAEFCACAENARETEKEGFIARMSRLLPRLYLEFTEPDLAVSKLLPDFGGEVLPSYVDEDFYEAVRRNVETLLGPDDTFLETFEEDMKYSDTPIAASISECIADIFQPLYNFIALVKESDGLSLTEAYLSCREDFDSYWSQTLCNVLRAINAIRQTAGV